MIKRIMFLMCLLVAMVWVASCCRQAPPVAAAPAPAVVAPAPVAPAPPPEVSKPAPEVQPAPSKKLKQRVIKGTEE